MLFYTESVIFRQFMLRQFIEFYKLKDIMIKSQIHFLEIQPSKYD